MGTAYLHMVANIMLKMGTRDLVHAQGMVFVPCQHYCCHCWQKLTGWSDSAIKTADIISFVPKMAMITANRASLNGQTYQPQLLYPI